MASPIFRATHQYVVDAVVGKNDLVPDQPLECLRRQRNRFFVRDQSGAQGYSKSGRGRAVGLLDEIDDQTPAAIRLHPAMNPGQGPARHAVARKLQTGREWWRERVCQYG